MDKYSIKDDRANFFNAIRSTKNTSEIIQAYLQYDGILYGDQIDVFRQKFSEAWSREHGETPFSVPMEGYDISQTYLDDAFPEWAALNFKEAEAPIIDRQEILPESPNQYEDRSIPSPPSLRLMRPTRAAFTLCRTQSTASSLFVFPHGYQYFQRDTGASLKSARSRKFSRSILRYERKNVSRAIVIIQDTFDGGSLAHFLLDWLPRIAYFIEAKVEPLQSTLFVLGGIPNEFHKKLLEALHCKYGLNDENVFFPQERMILDIAGPIYFFSDQVQAPLHPAHMAHPNSIEIIRDAINHITRDKGPYPRIFISRADATLRKIINEPEIESQLQAHGFKALRLSEYDVTTQLSLIRGAEIVVGAHGMGFTHSIAHDGGLKMLELFHPRIGSDAYIFIGKALSFGYRYLIGRDVADGLGSYKVDTNEVMVELKAFLSENAST